LGVPLVPTSERQRLPEGLAAPFGWARVARRWAQAVGRRRRGSAAARPSGGAVRL